MSWWPGDGNASDIVSTNNATLQGGANAAGAAFVAQGFTFDGTNSYVQIPDSPLLKPASLTVEAWVQFTGLDTPGNAAAGQQYIIFKQNSQNFSFEGYDLGKDRIGGQDVFTFRVSAPSGGTRELFSSTPVTTGVWYHVAGVRGSNVLQLYVNGQLDGQTNVSFAQNYGTQPLYFGTSGQSFWDRKFKGLLDEVSLYNLALSSNDIASIYLAGAAGKCKAVNITTHPQSQGVVIGSNATFTVSATGLAPLKYQWQFNGTDIAGATNTVLPLGSIQSSNAGNYRVTIGNSLGAVTSAVAVLTVWIPPAITSHPQSRTNVWGTDASFAVGATGTPAPGYQWLYNGVALKGATATSLLVGGVQFSQAGNYQVVVSNIAASVTSSVAGLVVVCPTVSVGPASLPEAIAGAPYNQSLTAVGGASPYTFSLIDGSLPAGIALSAGGVLQGLPVTPGESDFTVQATDTNGCSGSSTYSLTIGCPAILISPAVLSSGVVGGVYSVKLTATNGFGPYGFSVSEGMLPEGLSLSAGGLLSGTPVVLGTNGFTVTAADTNGCFAVQTYSLTVTGALPAIVGQPMSRTNIWATDVAFVVNATGVPAPGYQWQYNGVPLAGATGSTLAIGNVQFSQAGNYRVVVTNVVGSVTSAVATLSVMCPGVSLSPSALPGGTVGTAYAQALSASGGAGPYGYTLSAGALPAGVGLSPGGALSGMPVVPGTYNFSVQATDTNGCTGGRAYAITMSCPAITLGPATLPHAVIGTAYSQSLDASNGFGPYFFTNVTALPGGLSLSSAGLLSGAPTVLGTNIFTVMALDTNGCSGSRAFGLYVASAMPEIVQHPQGRIATAGASVSFSVSAAGTPPLSYSWRTNGVALPGADAPTLVLPNVGTNAAASYSVVITNIAGSVTSSVAPLAVVAPLPDAGVEAGSSAALSALCYGPQPLFYQWQFAGTNLADGGRVSGASTPTLQIACANPFDAGAYSLVVSDNSGASAVVSGVLSVVGLFSDPQLARALACALSNCPTLNCDCPPGSALLPALFTLAGANYGITNLTGLDRAVNLTNLDLSGNKVADLTPLQNLSNLVELRLGLNFVADCSPLTNLQNLSSLSVDGNPIGNYSALSSLTNLTRLSVFRGTITNLAFVQNLWRLRDLAISANDVNDVSPVLSLTNLEHLDLRWNSGLKNLDLLSGVTNLIALDLGGSSVSNLSFAVSLARLGRLNVSENQVTDLRPLAGLSNLTYLSLSQNPGITNYWVLSSLTNLVGLELRGNSITNLGFASGMQRLAYLDLAYNRVTDPSPVGALGNLSLILDGNTALDMTKLSGLTNVSRLWLAGAGLTNSGFLQNMPQLTACSVAYNAVSNTTDLLSLTNLTLLDLSHTAFPDYNWLASYPNLESLRLEANSISNNLSLPGKDNGRLMFLSLNTNALTEVGIATRLPYISSLYLTRNRLRNIDSLSGIGGLRFLDDGLNFLSIDSRPTAEALKCQGLRLGGGNITSGYAGDGSDNFGGQRQPPKISVGLLNPSGWWVPRNRLSVLPLTIVRDPLVPASQLILQKTSDNQAVVPDAALSLSGSGDNWSLSATPVADGVAGISVGAQDDPLGFTNLVLVPTHVVDEDPNFRIPDSNLSNVVWRTLGVKDRPMTSVDLLNFTELWAGSAGLSNLFGLQWATNLVSINLDYNSIRDISVLSNSTELISVSLSHNAISELSQWRNLTNLASLNLSANVLTNLHGIQSLYSLRFLALSDNRISELSPLVALTNLTYLDLSRNPVSDYSPLDAMLQLTNLVLSGNQISNLSFLPPLRNLASLTLTTNRIADAGPLSELTNLTFLSLDQNRLRQTTGLTNLAKLDTLAVRLNLLDLKNDPGISQLRARVTNFFRVPQRGSPWIDIQTNLLWTILRAATLPFDVFDSGPVGQEFFLGVSSAHPDLVASLTPVSGHGTNTNWGLVLGNAMAPGTSTYIRLAATNDVGLATNLLVQVISIGDLAVTDIPGFSSAGMPWNTGGDAAWFGESVVTFNGHPVAQSGAIGNLQQSWLQSAVTGPGRLSFWWKVSSEFCAAVCGDWLEFSAGPVTNRIHGEVDWRREAVPVGPGPQTLTWRYYKDFDTSEGWDAGWLTAVNFEPGIWLERAWGPTNGQLQLSLHGIPGRRYQVMVATNALQWPLQWLATQSPQLATNLSMPFTDTNIDTGPRFYRLIEAATWLERPLLTTGGTVRVVTHNPSRGKVVLQVSSNLVGWTDWTTNQSLLPVFTNTEAVLTNASQRFYRAVLLP